MVMMCCFRIALLKANNECLLKQLLANKKLREDEEKKTKEAASAESLSPRKDSRLIPGKIDSYDEWYIS